MKHPHSLRTLRTRSRRLTYLLLICGLLAAVGLSKTSQPASAETEKRGAVQRRAAQSRTDWSAVAPRAGIGEGALLGGVIALPVKPMLLAATITVNTTDDVLPVDGGDGKCTLREAITAANTDTALSATPGECLAGSGDDTITFDATVFATPGPHTINLTGVLPDLDSNIEINGPGRVC